MSKFIVLMYHSISTLNTGEEVPFVCEPERFEEHIMYLKKKGYYFASILEIKQYMNKEKDLPENSILVSFDDGYKDNYLNAYPVLLKYKIPAVIFLVVDLVGKNNEWMGESKNVKREMLTWEQIAEMKNNGIDFGSHTSTHPKLNMISKEDKFKEINQSKIFLEKLLEQPVKYFSYPFGLYDSQSLDYVKRAGYQLAVSTHSGFNNLTVDMLKLRRIEINGSDTISVLSRKIKFGTNDSGIHVLFKYYIKRIGKIIGLNS